MDDINDWLKLHPREVVIVYFGEIKDDGQDSESTVDKLKTILRSVFDGLDGSPSLNRAWQSSRSWPTLGEAIESNQRVFAIIRQKGDSSLVGDIDVLREAQLKLDKPDPVIQDHEVDNQ